MSALKAKGCLFLASSLCDGLEDNDIKQVTTLLLNKEANPNTLIPVYGVTPFHLVIGNDSEAFAEEVTKLFLRHKGDPNVRSVDGLTPVHVAAAWGRVSVLELLLANGGDPLCMDDEGRSPFHYAFDGKYYNAIVTLGKYCENTTKDEQVLKYKMSFDKLLISNGNTVAEYSQNETFVPSEDNILCKNTYKEHKWEIVTDTIHKVNSFHYGTKGINYGSWIEINSAELQIQEEVEKEKFLVNKIINQLSNSLKSNLKRRKVDKEDKRLEQSEFYKTPLHTPSTGSSMTYTVKDTVSLKVKPRKPFATPKCKRKTSLQKNNTKITLLPKYNPCDSIISKSPNFVINKPAEKDQRYFSPNALGKELKFKSFTPCTMRNSSFQSEEFNLGKEVARSTPRRKKRFYRQYSSHRKHRKHNGLTSSQTTSPDSINSLSPYQNCVQKPNYKFIKNLAIKLHENKYDEDIPGDSNKNRDCVATYTVPKESLKVPKNNFTNLTMTNAHYIDTDKDFQNYILTNECSDANMELQANCTANTFKENLNTFLSSFQSGSCIVIQEDYRYEDLDEHLSLLERRIYTLPPCKNEHCIPDHNPWPESVNLSMSTYLTNNALREQLINLGDNPGPVTNTTRQLYLKRLASLKNEPHNPLLIKSGHSKSSSKPIYFEHQAKSFLMYGDWINDLKRYKVIEKNAFKKFWAGSPSRKWREGISKTCFNYLLLDPRITQDLPSRAESLSESTIWNIFLSAIFYVGKGTRNRPYSHLKDAFDAWVSNTNTESRKIQCILNIWNGGYGVICLHLFQNSIPVEAYTREAALIDALGLQALKNCKGGDYYGIPATWTIEEKCNFGRYLLHQALQIFLYEGERQIFPQNL